MADAGEQRNGDALVGATRMGGLDYIRNSADALGRIPVDLLRYWSSLPANNEYEPLGVRAVQGTNYAIDSGLQALSGGRWGLAPIMAGLGLPTEGLERGIEDFGRRNAAPLQIASGIGEVAAGVAPALHIQRGAPVKALTQDEVLASRVVPGYNPIPKPQRPFEADYPSGAMTDGMGKLTRDTEGRRLGSVGEVAGGGADPASRSPVVIGRRVLGGQDETIPQTQGSYDALTKALIGAMPEATPARILRGDAGRLVKTVDDNANAIRRIRISESLNPSQYTRTTGHELGHAIDELAGQIPVKGLTKELEFVYNALTTGAERTKNLTRPKDLKYTPEEAPREMMAEAIRAYLHDPNYLKTVAPKTAAAIRGAVNDNPRLNNTIQFNQVLPVAAIPSLSGGDGEQSGSVPIFSLSPKDLRRGQDR